MIGFWCKISIERLFEYNRGYKMNMEWFWCVY